jgi:hypothetical protein
MCLASIYLIYYQDENANTSNIFRWLLDVILAPQNNFTFSIYHVTCPFLFASMKIHLGKKEE